MFNDYLDKVYIESSLSRIWSHNSQYDCGAISAFRKFTDCDGTNGEVLTKDENLRRNKILVAKLLSKGYGVTRLIGKYPEGGEEKKEVSYFVIDLKNSNTLEKDLRNLGEQFNQDSILFVPKGAINNEAVAYLVGTNHCQNNWLGYGKKEKFQEGHLSKESKIYTSYVNGRPFIFENEIGDITLPNSGFGNLVINKYAEEKV